MPVPLDPSVGPLPRRERLGSLAVGPGLAGRSPGQAEGPGDVPGPSSAHRLGLVRSAGPDLSAGQWMDSRGRACSPPRGGRPPGPRGRRRARRRRCISGRIAASRIVPPVVDSSVPALRAPSSGDSRGGAPPDPPDRPSESFPESTGIEDGVRRQDHSDRSPLRPASDRAMRSTPSPLRPPPAGRVLNRPPRSGITNFRFFISNVPSVGVEGHVVPAARLPAGSRGRTCFP